MFFSLSNDSFWCAFGTVIFLFAVPVFISQNKNRYLIALTTALLTLLLGYRTASLVAIVTLLLWLTINKNTKSWYFIAVIIIFPVLFLIKNGSSNGRWFIIKQTTAIIKENPAGVGLGNFKKAYGLQQAAWFKKHGFYNKEAQLADNNEFAFNEYLQLAAEAGIIPGIISVIFVCGIILWGVFYCHIYNHKSYLSFLTGFTSLSAASVTFYMLHNWWVLCFYLFCFCGMALCFIKVSKQAFLYHLIFFSGIACLLAHFTITDKRAAATIKSACGLSRAGYKQLADSIFFASKATCTREIALFSALADHNLYFGNIANARKSIDRALSKMTTDGLLMLSGDIYAAAGDTANAVKEYTTAIYMVPSRFISKKKLADLCKAKKDTANEIIWLQHITVLPEKVPNQISSNIKKEALLRLTQLKAGNPEN